jgi:hypothetical protein
MSRFFTICQADHLGSCEVSQHRHGAFGGWIERLRRIERLARVKIRDDSGFGYRDLYDSTPLPMILIAFRSNDAIVACFDEEAQSMLEGTSESSLAVAFMPNQTARFLCRDGSHASPLGHSYRCRFYRGGTHCQKRRDGPWYHNGGYHVVFDDRWPVPRRRPGCAGEHGHYYRVLL